MSFQALGGLAGAGLSIFGAQQGANNIGNLPRNWSTPYSFSAGGFTQIDPSIRAMQQQLLGQYQGLGTQYGNIGTGYQNLNARTQSNTGPYITAMLGPTEQAVNTGYGNLVTSQQNRGILGSSFGDQDQANFITAGNRSLADAGALAAQNITNSQLQGLAGQLNATAGQGSTLNSQNAIAQQRFQQELSALGISDSQSQALLQLAQARNQANMASNQAMGNGLMGLGSALGGMPGLGGGDPLGLASLFGGGATGAGTYGAAGGLNIPAAYGASGAGAGMGTTLGAGGGAFGYSAPAALDFSAATGLGAGAGGIDLLGGAGAAGFGGAAGIDLLGGAGAGALGLGAADVAGGAAAAGAAGAGFSIADLLPFLLLA